MSAQKSTEAARPRQDTAVHQVVAADVAQVWAMLADFGRLDAWLPDTEMVAATATGNAAERQFSIGSAQFSERLTGLDHARRRLSYVLLEGPLPVRDYEVTISASDLGDNRTRVDWIARYRPHGIAPDKCDRLLGRAFAASLEALRHRLEDRP